MSKERELNYEKKNIPLEALSVKGKYHDDFRGDCQLVPFGECRQNESCMSEIRSPYLSISSLATVDLISRCLQGLYHCIHTTPLTENFISAFTWPEK
jgi:hypothetical protein